MKVAIGVKEHDLAKINAVTMATNFATRWEDAPTETKATNIMTLLERFDRDFAENKTGKPVSTVHTTLSEYTHPNWSGMAGSSASEMIRSGQTLSVSSLVTKLNSM
jgi:hypothetical protein